MRTLALAVLLSFSVLACSSGGSSTAGGRSGSSAGKVPSSRLKASDIKPVTDPVHVRWISFKDRNPRDGKPMGTKINLINNAHPKASKPIPIDAFMKVLTDQQMGLLLALLDERGFTRYSRPGLTDGNAPFASGNGIIVVTRGNRSRGLLFEKQQRATASQVPKAYVECKNIIVQIFNSADQFQVYTSDQDRVLEIEDRLEGGVKR